MNRLLLLRHASAAFGAPGMADIDRPLSERGLKEAAALGERLRDEGLLPDNILCSTARRARQTLQALGEPFSTSLPVTWSEELYRTDADGCRNLISAVDEKQTLMVIGHNPTLEDLLFESIASAAPDVMAAAEARGLVQSAFAVLQFEGDYLPFANDTGKLVAFIAPEP